MTIEVVNGPTIEESADKPARKRPRWVRPLIIASAVVVLVGAAAAITWGVLSSQHSPTAYAERFLLALTEGRASDAVSLLTRTPDGAAIIDEAGYAAAGQHLESYRMGETVTQDDGVTVNASLTQDGRDYEAELPLVAAGPAGPFGLFTEWRIKVGALPRLSVTVPPGAGTGLVANELPIAELPDAARKYVTVLPGAYEFAVADPNPLFTVGAESVTAKLGKNDAAVIAAELTEEGVAAARQAVEAHIASCLSQPTLAPPGDCGLVAEPEPGFTYTNLRWSLVTAPTYEIEEWRMDGATVTNLTDGALRLDADYSAEYETGTAWWTWDGYKVIGSVQVVDGALSFVSAFK